MKRFVIVGGGTAGWMAAAALARFLPAGTDIRLVESDAIGTIGVGEATIPQIQLFNSSIGVSEDELLRRTGATIKLGIRFDGWGAPDQSYIHAFGAIGRPLGLIDFHHYWLRHRHFHGVNEPLHHYSLAARAADAGVFAPDRNGGLAWAYHFDATLYARLLRDHAAVERIEGRIVHVDRDADGIAALRLDDGRVVEGDFFIDCSGLRALLIGEALGVPFDDWSDDLPCDRALAVPSARLSPPPPYTRATAHDAGWMWRIPLQHRTGNGIVYSSAHLTDDAAHDRLLASLDGPPLDTPRPIRFRTGRRRVAWSGNCVALGLAAGFLEPLESTSIHLVQSAIARLLAFLPGDRIEPLDVATFNRQTEAEWTAVRDFLVLHYHLNGRDEPFWHERRERQPPTRVAEAMARFHATGRIVRSADDLFAEAAWLQVLLGQGIEPVGHHPLAAAVTPAELAEFIALAGRQVDQALARLAPHAHHLATHPFDGRG